MSLSIFVGTTNPGKIAAVNMALSKYQAVTVSSQAVPSGVAAQPMTDEETRQGARQRAQAALTQGLATSSALPAEALGLGLEGGVMTLPTGEMWMTVWAVVVDQAGDFFEANGIRQPVPELVAAKIKAGIEMGAAMDQLTHQTNLKHDQGMLGIITKGKVSRTEAYAALAELALGQWFGREWATDLPISSS